ncbi:MAG: nickel pincer cofactor biosynthesis protein LarC [Anaerolineales bacterium]|nr:nickel pincer cofactor biosynthesis protein LarC [Anaerolineales bacterium]
MKHSSHAHQTIAYVDPFSGIAGDMLLAAFLDAGMSIDHLNKQFQTLPIQEKIRVYVEETITHGIRSSRLSIHMENTEPQDHRHLSHILEIIGNSGLTHGAKEKAEKVFTVLAEAEAKVHGTDINSVHFHEVGAIDSILDILGIAICLDHLRIDKLFCGPLPLSGGTVKTEHGLLPVPAPAVGELLSRFQIPVRPMEAVGEVVTPTGAAVVAALAEFQQPHFIMEKMGLGSGQKEFPWANILRVMIGKSAHMHTGEMVVLETNIDDMTGEHLGYLLELLFDSGARDVYFTPISMKKNRPAVKLSVLVDNNDEMRFAELILRESTTLGVRSIPVNHRIVADRRMETVETPYGEIRVKRKILNGETLQVSPEYNDCAELARKHSIPIAKVYESVVCKLG